MRIPALLAEAASKIPAPPTGNIPEGATVIGTLPAELQSLYGLYSTLIDETNKAADAAKALAEQGLPWTEAALAYDQKGMEAEIVYQILWFEARAHFGLYEDVSVGLATDWQVWRMTNQCHRCPMILILGGGGGE